MSHHDEWDAQKSTVGVGSVKFYLIRDPFRQGPRPIVQFYSAPKTKGNSQAYLTAVSVSQEFPFFLAPFHLYHRRISRYFPPLSLTCKKRPFGSHWLKHLSAGLNLSDWYALSSLIWPSSRPLCYGHAKLRSKLYKSEGCYEIGVVTRQYIGLFSRIIPISRSLSW